MRARRTLLVGAVTATMLLGPSTGAWALHCYNASRPAPDDISQPVVTGNWAWVPELGEWLFVPPGTEAPAPIEFPGANGNFQNGRGHALLDNSGAVDNGRRQTEHGIQHLSFEGPGGQG